MQPSNFFHINVCNVGCLMRHLDWFKMCIFCKLVNHHHDGMMLLYYSRKLGNEIYGNNLPFPLKNGQWL
jgi:hypothetical protein